MKKLIKGITVITGIVVVSAIVVEIFEKVTGKNIVDEAEKFLDKLDEDDFDSDFDDDLDDLEDEDNFEID